MRCDRVLPGKRTPCRRPLVARTDAIGRVIWTCQHCAWQRSGRCWRCGMGRDKARAIYCAACRVLAQQEAGRRHERSLTAKRAARVRDRERNRTEERRAWRAAWREANPDRIRCYKRKEALNPTPQRRERERWWNAQPERQAKKREQAMRRYYELHPERPKPVCRECAQPIAWTPPGRPPVRCDRCVPDSVRAKRKRTYVPPDAMESRNVA